MAATRTRHKTVQFVTSQGKTVSKHNAHMIMASRGIPLRIFNKRSVRKRLGYQTGKTVSVYRVRTKTKRSGVTTRRVATIGRGSRILSPTGTVRSYKSKVQIAQQGGFEVRMARSAGRIYLHGATQVRIVSRPHGSAGGHGGQRHRRTFFARDSHGRFK